MFTVNQPVTSLIFALLKNSNLLPFPVITAPHTPDYYSIGNPFIELQSVDSTNNYAMAQVHEGLALPGTAYFAHEQFAGKGQRGKVWLTKPGENIMMSVVLPIQTLSVNEQFVLSACIALSCFDLLNSYLAGEIFIKWPNDLYVNDRKTGGILIENIISGENWKCAIVGIGININQTIFDERLPNPTSLQQETGQLFDAVTLAKELCACIEKRFFQLNKKSTEKIIDEYNKVLYKKGKPVRLKKDNIVFETVIEKVNSKGELITKDVIERSFGFGEVEFQR
ncbi:MAG: biotin--[acetyl-CoA-carboxylase] ligase [Bacteroidetes bacterium]|nr:biotin--[acetyl-CoA-carboxylase] ligase [Bacteroidota bacterium]MBS1933282.1 biotin--[acetyl-CoA-carboxylase] ligase [Bacteroidota bacterium]